MEDLVTCRIRLTKDCSELLKEEGRRYTPRKSREAIMYEIIEPSLKKIERRNSLRELRQEQGK